MNAWPHQSALDDYYGRNLRISRGVAGPDPAWERANLVLVPIPWRAVAAWDTTLPIRALRVHGRCAESLSRALAAVKSELGQQKWLEAAGMHLIGGGYVWRSMRGGVRLSTHAYGAAVDFDPARNGLGDPTPAMPPVVVAAFESEGWTWGGRWSPQRRDGMHFQAADV